MMNSSDGHGRQQGVRGTAPTTKKGYTPKSLLGMQLGQVALITYADDTGAAHENMVFFFGGKAYMDAKGGERWLRDQLGEVSPWLAEQLAPVYERQLAAVVGTGIPTGAEEAEIPEPEVDVVAKPVATKPNPKSTQERLVTAITGHGGG